MNLKDEKAADLAQVLEAIGEAVTWKGRTFQALVSNPTLGEELDLGGFTGTGDFTIKIMRSAFTGDLPKLGDIIGFEGGRFRITRLTNHPQFPMLVLVVTPAE